MGLVQKCGGRSAVSPRHSKTRVRRSVIVKSENAIYFEVRECAETAGDNRQTADKQYAVAVGCLP